MISFGPKIGFGTSVLCQLRHTGNGHLFSVSVSCTVRVCCGYLRSGGICQCTLLPFPQDSKCACTYRPPLRPPEEPAPKRRSYDALCERGSGRCRSDTTLTRIPNVRACDLKHERPPAIQYPTPSSQSAHIYFFRPHTPFQLLACLWNFSIYLQPWSRLFLCNNESSIC